MAISGGGPGLMSALHRGATAPPSFMLDLRPSLCHHVTPYCICNALHSPSGSFLFESARRCGPVSNPLEQRCEAVAKERVCLRLTRT